ncbi:hypothetical protein L9W92_01515 [Pelotomaculum terephthalicicum JT]|uniref:hypothetical protein n=1 Tax=Pelotomaculum TaxID=191373 RepID=UPI0009CBE997|nr:MULTISPECIES: hypothetical protein [Pelotomaculum]MCG9966735.1 hypothetical protein [Pelotomaculum terephthalicicum JT]OPX85576.1 MAG: hypothetical protein A4E54_02385 [Pelotomaculum sp. PtaB.Bin117]
MIFPPVTKVVFAADASGKIKARLKPGTAARDLRRKKARKISDNLIQYDAEWKDKEPIVPRDDEIILIGTISKYSMRRSWLKTDKKTLNNIFEHNERVARLVMPGLESIPLGDPHPVTDIMLIYKKCSLVN